MIPGGWDSGAELGCRTTNVAPCSAAQIRPALQLVRRVSTGPANSNVSAKTADGPDLQGRDFGECDAGHVQERVAHESGISARANFSGEDLDVIIYAFRKPGL
jgi:hypothetical protein